MASQNLRSSRSFRDGPSQQARGLDLSTAVDLGKLSQISRVIWKVLDVVLANFRAKLPIDQSYLLMRLESEGRETPSKSVSPPPRVCFFSQTDKIKKNIWLDSRRSLNLRVQWSLPKFCFTLHSLLTGRPPNLNPILRLLQNRQTC